MLTGGASDIDAFAAKLFAQNGAKVIIADVQSDLHRRTDHFHLPPRPIGHLRQVQRRIQDRRVDTAVSAHGKLDIMFSNAGIMGQLAGMQIATTDSQDLAKVLEVNVRGAFHCAKHAARVMIGGKKGVIIFTTSNITTMFGNAPHAYTTSKHVVVGLMKNLTVELGGYGVWVNSISPNGVPTPMAMNALGLDRRRFRSWVRSRRA
ncbi:unnamed protein product [Linum tenue]|uniref:Uncharacterized protein n=1 Tax=Linum tenue TaxID=586396 RepID=A0AAV0Q3W6_9ROSI|nr:unnamed protein product [Linum tenue]